MGVLQYYFFKYLIQLFLVAITLILLINKNYRMWQTINNLGLKSFMYAN